MHSGFGAQPAEGVLALKIQGSAFDSGHFPRRDFHDLRLEIILFAPAQVHPEQHFRPVLGFRAARACLDVEIGIIGVHGAGEHAPEFQLFQYDFGAMQILERLVKQTLVVFVPGKLNQALCIIQGAFQSPDVVHHSLEFGAFPTQGLGVFRLVPDLRIAEFELYFGKAFLFAVVVKDTP